MSNKNTGGSNKGKKPLLKADNVLSTAFVCCVIFVCAYALVHIGVLFGFLKAILSVFTTVLLGAAIAYMLNPLLKFFEFKVFKKLKNKNVLRTLSLICTYLTAILVLVAIAALFVPALIQSITKLTGNMDTYLFSTTQYLNGIIAKFTDDHDVSNIISVEKLEGAIARFFFSSGNVLDTVMTYVTKYGAVLVTGVKNILVAFFISIYVLSSKERIKAQFKKLSAALFKNGGRSRLRRYIRLAHRTFGGFFVSKTVDSLFIMLISLIVFAIAGIEHALLVSVIIGITNFIPVFGPFIGAIPSFFIIFISDIKDALLFLLLLFLIYQIYGRLIGPRLFGKYDAISSLGVIVSMVIMGAYFGIAGMIIGVPVFATAIAICKEFIDAKLKKADLPSDTSEYYSEDSLVDPNEHHESFFDRIFRGIKKLFERIISLKKKTSKTDENNDKKDNGDD